MRTLLFMVGLALILGGAYLYHAGTPQAPGANETAGTGCQLVDARELSSTLLEYGGDYKLVVTIGPGGVILDAGLDYEYHAGRPMDVYATRYLVTVSIDGAEVYRGYHPPGTYTIDLPGYDDARRHTILVESFYCP